MNEKVNYLTITVQPSSSMIRKYTRILAAVNYLLLYTDLSLYPKPFCVKIPRNNFENSMGVIMDPKGSNIHFG